MITYDDENNSVVMEYMSPDGEQDLAVVQVYLFSIYLLFTFMFTFFVYFFVYISGCRIGSTNRASSSL